MRILSWNINRYKECADLMYIIDALQDHNPEVIILHDSLNNRQGQILRNAMGEVGWEHQYFTGVGSQSGILILSRKHFSLNRCNYRKPTKSYGWLDLLPDNCRASILAVNIPKYDHLLNTAEYWERLLEYTKIKMVDNCLIIGTLCSEQTEAEDRNNRPIKEILKTGWVELIQYYQNKDRCIYTEDECLPERIEYAFASRMVKDSVSTAYFSAMEKEKGFMCMPMVLELV